MYFSAILFIQKYENLSLHVCELNGIFLLFFSQIAFFPLLHVCFVLLEEEQSPIDKVAGKSKSMGLISSSFHSGLSGVVFVSILG